jgi:hypothetical protein
MVLSVTDHRAMMKGFEQVGSDRDMRCTGFSCFCEHPNRTGLRARPEADFCTVMHGAARRLRAFLRNGFKSRRRSVVNLSDAIAS